jgi:Ras GTPase-activating-like protein IQGAP2/3
MSYSHAPRTRLGGHSATSPSPLRNYSTASNGSSTYSSEAGRHTPSRSSTLSSSASNGYPPPPTGHRRGMSEATTLTHPRTESYFGSEDTDAGVSYASLRKNLRPLPSVPQSSPVPEKPVRPTASPTTHTHTRSQSVESTRFNSYDGSVSPPSKPRPLSMAISRADSIRAPTRDHPSRLHPATNLERPSLQSLGKSTTGHLRTLSKFAETASEEDFTIKSPEQEVVGLHGRRRLQRSDTARGKKTGSSWASRNWMDQQRQFLQAYEYLCHIGEAKEWIEDIIHKDIPPIVELEEALRDGVTLAEVVQAIEGRQLRIFHDAKLQWRHSNNYAHFFKFLADVELPDLFRFELVDLYEKKNVPKVIYCIHALSWLLFRKGMVDFRIGNLVGKLQFEDHELETMQKGLDKSGVSMPNFSGMSAKFAVEPEPEPEPVETEQDRIDRELSENETVVLDLQAQIRGAMLRMQLGNTMQNLWDNEELIIDLQSRIRGDWARQIAYYRLDMRRFAIQLQSAARGFLIRSRLRGEEEFWRDKEPQVLKVQNLFRGRKARAEVQYTRSKIQRHENGIREFQAAIRGALQRLRVNERYEETRNTEPAVQHIQSMIRGALVRLKVDHEYAELKEHESQFVEVQAVSRAMLVRQSLRADQENLRQNESIVTLLQAAARGAIARKQNFEIQEKLVSTDVNWFEFQSKIRGDSLRNSLRQQQEALQAEVPQITDLQAVARGGQLRSQVADTLAQLNDQESLITSLQSYMRGYLSRQRHHSDLKELQAQVPTILDLQAACRGYMQRQRTYDVLCELNNQESEIIQLQALSRAMTLRMQIGLILAQVEEHEDIVTELQALARGMMVRQKFAEKQKHYKQNMEKVIKIQSFVRGRQQGESYKSLTSGKNPPVSTVKNFVHLLNDSDIDFDEEIGKSHISCQLIYQILTLFQSLSVFARPWFNTCGKTNLQNNTSTSWTSRSHYLSRTRSPWTRL